MFLILCLGLSGCAVVSDKWYCENTFGAYEISYPKICFCNIKMTFKNVLEMRKTRTLSIKKENR